MLCVTVHVHRFMQEAEMRMPKLKRIAAVLRQLTPDQRKSVAVELTALDAQPASTVLIEGVLRMWRDVPARQVYT